MGLLHPPLSESTPLASLDMWSLVMRCPNCGDRNKPIADLFVVVHPSTAVGKVIPLLSCQTCRSKPVALFGTCTWQMKYGRDPVREDWSSLLSKIEANAA
jgi:hypothetical protein